jgi:hypothetical protein
MPLGPNRILANHLLQKHDISVHRADRLTKAVQNKPSISHGKAFVNVDGYYSQLSHAD